MTLGKHFINGISNPVVRGLYSVASQDESLRVIESEKVLYRQQEIDKVLLLSGGGSGHEPAHAGYVGEGMLDICVAGEIFASPSATQVLAGLLALPSPKGVLMIVKNYTGDKLNFCLAAQKAKALGIEVNVVFVGDDVSVEGNQLVGRRGLAGVVGTLEEVTEAAQKAADRLITVGVSLDRCDVPNRETQDGLPHGELEYGMGIHNEPGVRRATVPVLSVTVSNVLGLLEPSVRLPNHNQVVVMINNLGGLSVLELHIIAKEVLDQVRAEGLEIRRALIGTFVTSLNGSGFSVTLLGLDHNMEKLLNEDTKLTNWPNLIPASSLDVKATSSGVSKTNTSFVVEELNTDLILPIPSSLVQDILNSVTTSVIKDEPLITHYDTIAGDGDCGETLLKGVQAAAAALQPFLSRRGAIGLHVLFRVLASSIETSTGGTSGAIYAIFFNALFNALPTRQNIAILDTKLTYILADVLPSALAQLYRYTTARRGHKTLMDALIPFVEVFGMSLDLRAAVQAADEGAQGTRRLKAVMGRASYVGQGAFSVEGGVPDPGALGVVSVLRGIETAVRR
ncbi:hypothetical protein V502_10366 [Pseudogymnoascus sp. VKM F-4520 (FW-2644)]|nr:hypothetical protein V502_10366 [Pseudogymnoascus sp. VKM F-4520 (FW-2644)]